jgi:molecular chaperone DnaJ
VLIAKVGQCDVCKGNGAKPGTALDTCKTCNGSGRVHETRNTIFGQQTIARACDACDGSGKVPKEKCIACTGRGVSRKEEEVRISIPGGIENGEMMRMTAQGEAVKGGQSGDLYVKVHVKPHMLFRKDGPNLIMELPIKVSDALLGTTATVTTIDDKTLEVQIPPLSGATETLRIRGKGVQGRGGNHGDLLINVSVALPKKLSHKAKQAIEALKSEGL